MVSHAFAVQAQYRHYDRHLYGFEVLARDSRNPEVNSAFGVLSSLKSEDDYFELDFQALIFAVNFLDILRRFGIKCRVSVNAEISSLQRTDYSNYLNLYDVSGLVIEITERQDLVSNEGFISNFVKSNEGILFAIDDFTPSINKVEFLFRNTFFRQVKFADPSILTYIRDDRMLQEVEKYCYNCGAKLIIEKATSFSIPPELLKLRDLVILQGFALHLPVYVGSEVTKADLMTVLGSLQEHRVFGKPEQLATSSQLD